MTGHPLSDPTAAMTTLLLDFAAFEDLMFRTEVMGEGDWPGERAMRAALMARRPVSGPAPAILAVDCGEDALRFIAAQSSGIAARWPQVFGAAR